MLYDKHFISNVKLLTVSSICWSGSTATVGFDGVPTIKNYIKLPIVNCLAKEVPLLCLIKTVLL